MRSRSASKPQADFPTASEVQSGVRWLVVLQLAARAGRLALVLGLAFLSAGLTMEGGLGEWPLALFASGLILSLGAGSAGERLKVRLEEQATLSSQKVIQRYASRSPVSEIEGTDSGALASRLARHPALAAKRLVSVAASKTACGAGMLMAIAAMTLFSWQAALLLLATLPVMILFFVFVGGLTKAKAERQEESLASLAGAFADRVRCLPSILANHAVTREGEALTDELQAYRKETAGLLRVAFLNSAVLDFFSSLSIAMLAIFLGLGHLGLADVPGFSGLVLSQSLAILILAPEVFQPLRRHAELYHQSAEGDVALAALTELAVKEEEKSQRIPAGAVAVRGLILKQGIVVGDLDLPSKGLVAVTGASGCGKTSLLRALAGVDKPREGQVFKPAESVSWASADCWLPSGNVHETLGPDADALITTLNLDRDPRIRDRSFSVDDGGSELSGGQRLRLGIAFAAMSQAGILYADEPTAKLDENSAVAVRGILNSLAREKLVVIATHDEALAALADLRIPLGATSEVTA